MAYEIGYCTGCRVLQVKPELAADMPTPELPQWSMGFPTYCPVCKLNTVFQWTEMKRDPD